ncbi:PspC domain-containing protein [Flavobacterium sp. 3HN19-14]|uniref:PspC domain-containing protein n=1 Tax=Flavobacterium sp. 3HN19-14 TaxID=3448133 RepID=UPI003EDEFB5B
MNKTVNINLGGMVFHIDEDAYQKLTRYFEAIKRSLSNSNGQDEIIKDIEMRIAELISEKHTNEKQVISLKELDEVIAVMGQPEDYRLDNEEDDNRKNTSFNTASSSDRPSKKLYRDRETGMIGGVLAGLGHYFGIDKVWLRIALLALFFFYGVGFVAYIILWIVIPEAVTTSEKLEMKGEAINISNIERKVREEFENVAERLKNVNYDEMGNKIKTGSERFATSIGDVFVSIFKVFAKILGVFMIIFALPGIVMLLIGVFTLGSTAFIPVPLKQYIEAGNFSDYPIWVLGLLLLFAFGIPLFCLALLGFKLLITNMKSIGSPAKYTLIALWVLSVGMLVTLGIKQASEFAFEGNVMKKEALALNTADTLLVKFRRSEQFSNNIHDHRDFMITTDSTGARIIYSDNIRFRIERTDEKQAYLEIGKQAQGSSIFSAKKTAENIRYTYKLDKNQLLLDNYLLTDFKNKYRGQTVTVTLFLPAGIKFRADENVQSYDDSDDEYFNLHFSSDKYIYESGDSKIKCLNCPAYENEHNDVDVKTETTTTESDTAQTTIVKVNGEVISIQTSGKDGKTTVGTGTSGSGLTKDKDGVIIKK